MPIAISSRFDFTCDQPTDIILQFEAAAIPEQRVLSTDTRINCADIARVAAHDGIGERVLFEATGKIEVGYEALVEVERLAPDISGLAQLSPHDLPGETLDYLLDSRYCPADRFQPFVEDEFGGTSGGARVQAIHDWIAQHFTYEQVSTTSTTALDSFVERRGICRDYAHVLITLARASTIPARYVSCYAPGVTPPDFHAVAEAHIDGSWHVIDPTGLAPRQAMLRITAGRDSSDTAFLSTVGGSLSLKSLKVSAGVAGELPVEDPATAVVLG